jgi:uncharacterized protein DUF3237
MNELPDPVLTQVYRLKAVPGATLKIDGVQTGDRRIVPLVGGTFTGPELNGNLLPVGSACWQIVSSDGTALTDVRYTLQTDSGALLYVRSSGVDLGGSIELGERVFHTATRIETAAPYLDWLASGVLVTVVGRAAVNLLYETYLVG